MLMKSLSTANVILSASSTAALCVVIALLLRQQLQSPLKRKCVEESHGFYHSVDDAEWGKRKGRLARQRALQETLTNDRVDAYISALNDIYTNILPKNLTVDGRTWSQFHFEPD